jgi:hypothetical protein
MRDCSAGKRSFQSGSNASSELRTSDSVKPLMDLRALRQVWTIGGEQEKANLVDDDLLDLGSGNAGNGTIAGAPLQDGLAQIIAIESAILPCVRRRHG